MTGNPTLHSFKRVGGPEEGRFCEVVRETVWQDVWEVVSGTALSRRDRDRMDRRLGSLLLGRRETVWSAFLEALSRRQRQSDRVVWRLGGRRETVGSAFWEAVSRDDKGVASLEAASVGSCSLL